MENSRNYERLVSMGAKRWTKGDHDRLYLNKAGIRIMGLEVKRYNTGNISSAHLDGERISNSEGRRILAGVERAYIDLETGEVKGVGDKYVDRLMEGLEAVTAE